ncbi:MAG: hypothetical protein HOH64_02765 [Rhodospirillales bacterium]|nr:hypothetical protein [Rhodospirillales bacterium]MBT6109005.1 hypothetical protein [Rhodospirillales bacterium]
MSVLFVPAAGRIPVIVPRPEIREVEFADGRFEYEAHPVRYLSSHYERGLFDIGTMLDILQFGNITRTERYVIQALQRRLTFSGKLDFPGLAESGALIPVQNTEEDLVWATVSQGISVTRSFTILDLCHNGMALDNPEYLREVIESNQRGCPGANAEALLKRFQIFTPRRREEVSRALNKLVELGILRELEKLDNYRYRAVFNPHLVVSTRSGIIRGAIKAENVLRFDGAEISYTLDLGAAREPANRSGTNVTGRRPYITRDAYQSMYDAEHVDRVAIENRLAKAQHRIQEYEESGYLSLEQDMLLRQILDDPMFPEKLRNQLKHAFTSAYADPLSEIPTPTNTMKGKRNA